jgi:hypothetical protein
MLEILWSIFSPRLLPHQVVVRQHFYQLKCAARREVRL